MNFKDQYSGYCNLLAIALDATAEHHKLAKSIEPYVTRTMRRILKDKLSEHIPDEQKVNIEGYATKLYVAASEQSRSKVRLKDLLEIYRDEEGINLGTIDSTVNVKSPYIELETVYNKDRFPIPEQDNKLSVVIPLTDTPDSKSASEELAKMLTRHFRSVVVGNAEIDEEVTKGVGAVLGKMLYRVEHGDFISEIMLALIYGIHFHGGGVYNYQLPLADLRTGNYIFAGEPYFKYSVTIWDWGMFNMESWLPVEVEITSDTVE